MIALRRGRRIGRLLMARITIEAWDGEQKHRMRLKDDANLEAVMTKIEHDTPLRGVDDMTKRPAVIMPRSCCYIMFEEE